MMRRLSRRSLVAAVAACAAGFGRRASPRVASGASAETHPLAAAYTDLNCPDAIGMACLRALPPADASREVLASLIIRRGAIHTRDLNSRVLVRRFVRAQSRQDFRSGAVKNVDGWILSLTEMRVYALAALLAREGARGIPQLNAVLKG